MYLLDLRVRHFVALFGKISCIVEKASLVAQMGMNLLEMWEA